MEKPGKQYPYEKTGGLEPGRFKPIAEPCVVEKDPVVFTGLENAWVTVDKVGIPSLGLEGTVSARLFPLLQKTQEYWRRRTWLGYLPTLLKDWVQTHSKNNPDPLY